MIGDSSTPLMEGDRKKETVYGDGSSYCDGASVDSGEGIGFHGGQDKRKTRRMNVISDKVRSLANNVYQEFESLIDVYGRDVVNNLMPLVIQCLENLDHLYSEKSDLEVEMDLLKEDNNQLIGQFEKERTLRKGTEEKILHIEDRHEEYKNDVTTQIEALEMNIKMLEMKSKSSQDHVIRLEEKEAEMKKENSRLHERFNDLLRNHMEAVERGKAVAMATEPDSVSVGSAPTSRVHIHHHHFHSRTQSDPRTGDKVKELTTRKEFEEVNDGSDIDELGVSLEHELSENGPLDSEANGDWQARDEELDGLEHDGTMFEEMTMPDEVDVQSDEGPDCIDDQDYESEFGMSREIDNLIKENMELVETKNALNIVKDDLITQLDDLSGENEVLRDEVAVLTDIKHRLKNRIRSLETEMKETKTKLDKANEKLAEMGDDEDENGESEGMPAHRKRFTRSEMVRLLSERNQYKERLMELEDAVRWTEMMRAKRDHPELVSDGGAGSTSGRRGMWKYFSGLFGTGMEEAAPSTPPPASNAGLNVFNANASSASPAPSSATKSSESQDSPPTRRSGARGGLSAASNALAAFASFLAPSPMITSVGNPLFMPPPTNTNLAVTGVSPVSSSSAESRANTSKGTTIPKLVAHDIKLLPAPRAPGSAVKRIEGDEESQR